MVVDRRTDDRHADRTHTAPVQDVRDCARQLAHVVARIADDPALPAGADPQQVMEETLKFLEVAASSDQPVAPSRTVDIGWHHFILCTRDYRDYTATHLGRFIHHVPDGRDGDAADTGTGDVGSDDTYAGTRRRIGDRFGPLDPTLWPAQTALADCQSQGNCSSNSSGDCSSS